MKNKKETFASLMHLFERRYNLHTIFDDFLTLTIYAVTRNPSIGKSHYEDLYLKTIATYKDDPLRHNFPKMFACLVSEATERMEDDKGNDVLGEFFEEHLANSKMGQILTPWYICKFMSNSVSVEARKKVMDRTLRIMDPSCGSGRMLLAAAKENQPSDEYYGIDIDSTCVKMTALNLFLNGAFNSEVLCADALLLDDFRFSYRLSLVPLGIFKIEEKEKSRLWHLLRNSLQRPPPENDLKLPSELRNEQPSSSESTQLTFF